MNSVTVDSDSSRVVTIVDCDGNKHRHPGRVWDASTLGEKHASFLNSLALSACASLPNFKTPSLSSFNNHSYKCLSNPTSHSCVDIIKSELYHYRKAMQNELITNSNLKNKTLACNRPLHSRPINKQWTSCLNASIEKFTHFSTCPKVPHPSLVCEDCMPSFIPWDCANSKCQSCGPDRLELLSCPIFNNESSPIPTNEWHLAPQPGDKTQLELDSFKCALPAVIAKPHSSLSKAINHQAHLRWKLHCLKLDSEQSNPNNTLVFCADFGATLDLSAAETDNCSVANHAAVCAFYFLHDWEDVSHDEINDDKEMLTKTKRVSECDRWISFISTQSKGKKNDHVAHNAILERMLSYYE